MKKSIQVKSSQHSLADPVGINLQEEVAKSYQSGGSSTLFQARKVSDKRSHQSFVTARSISGGSAQYPGTKERAEKLQQLATMPLL